MSYLPYIADDLLLFYTKDVLDRVMVAYTESEAKIHSNVIDPFSALFDAMRQGITVEDWLNQERSRQVQKTLQNAVGDFHQNILGSIDGWHNPGRGGGYDLISHENKILVEIKNKHNTLNSSGAESTYGKLTRYIDSDEYKDFTAYVVFIVPKSPSDFNGLWSPNQEKMPLREDVRKIDGESFYKLVTGYDDALENLFDILPDIIAQELKTQSLESHEKFILKELFTKAYK
ncbi:MAG: Type site-specific deoxyribonuclease [Candidatus Saccharibacteria bacterium]|nr:Type site-specific deoxyribonuclease [Candidatus Saccharibacteria bacterium]